MPLKSKLDSNVRVINRPNAKIVRPTSELDQRVRKLLEELREEEQRDETTPPQSA